MFGDKNFMTKPKYWIQESKSYFKKFQNRLGANLENSVEQYIGFLDELAAEPDLGRCSIIAGFLSYEAGLLMANCYCRNDWPSYIRYRSLHSCSRGIATPMHRAIAELVGATGRRFSHS